MMEFPYGRADFHKIITEDFFYIDRSGHIPLIEKAGDTLLFLRPRRFGKSLLISMLENYYDVGKAGEFEQLFGKLAIGRNPTPKRNRYLILKWNFSEINPQGDVRDIRQKMHDHVNGCLEMFRARYHEYLEYDIALDTNNALRSLQSVLAAVGQTPYKVFLLIDEYDNFANEVLMAGRSGSRERYEALIRGEGMLKTVFKAIKSGTEGRGIDRVFIAGVSPVVMSDVTSGFNIAADMYLDPEFNDLCGFHEHEVAETVDRIAETCRFSEARAAEALAMMRTFYDGELGALPPVKQAFAAAKKKLAGCGYIRLPLLPLDLTGWCGKNLGNDPIFFIQPPNF